MANATGGIIFQPVFDAEIESIAEEDLIIYFNTTGELSVQIEILDANGRSLLIEDLSLPNGKSTQRLNMSFLSLGQYFIRISNPYNAVINKQILLIP